MEHRRVTRSRKDLDGETTALCDPDEPWSHRSKPDAISYIENHRHSYYLMVEGKRAGIHVVKGPAGKLLRTDLSPSRELLGTLDGPPLSRVFEVGEDYILGTRPDTLEADQVLVYPVRRVPVEDHAGN